jgi:protein TonB
VNRQVKALLISLAIHALVLASITSISESFAGLGSNVVIDLTLLDYDGADTAVFQKTHATEKRSISAPEKPDKKQPTPAHNQHPVTEVGGMVPVRQIQRETVHASVKQLFRGSQNTGIGQKIPSLKRQITSNISESGGGSEKSFEQLRLRYVSEHFQYIKEMIQQKITYPHVAKRFGWTGKVTVSFIVLENGRADNIKVLKSSGYNLLDRNVIETIKFVSPFPKPPVKAELRMPITYQLE